MSAKKLITDHDLWRKNMGGAPAGVAGQSDGDAYDHLDLNLITFSDSHFAGSSFTSTTFQEAVWSSCRFNGCSFDQCDLQRAQIKDCSFENCTFGSSLFQASRLGGCVFTRCDWAGLNFDASQWSGVRLLDCTGRKITATDLRGSKVDLTGSRFEDMRFVNARIN